MRGRVEEVLRSIVYGGKCKGCKIIVIDRAVAGGLRTIPVDRIVRVKHTYLELDDGTLIPLHRVIGIEDAEGKRILLR